MISSEDEARSYVAGLCDAEAVDKLEALAAALREENERQNLVSRGTLDSVWHRHIADSAQLLRSDPHEALSWLDLGTGAGFPGLVIAAMRPAWPVTLVESRRKRSDWLAEMKAKLELSNCRVEARRLELVERFSARIISARAFAPLPRTIDLAQRFSTSDTLWLLPKGRSAEQELHDLPERWRTMFHVEQSLTDREAKILVGTGGARA